MYLLTVLMPLIHNLPQISTLTLVKLKDVGIR